MAVYNNISSKFIVAKIYRDLGLTDPNYQADFFEWIGEALEFIGSGSQLISKELVLEIKNYKATLPIGIVTLEQVRTFSEFTDNWEYLQYNPSTFNILESDAPNFVVKTKHTFSLNPNFIIFSFEEGEVAISYKTFATDEDGFPLLPDNQYFKEALFWYCFKKMLMKGYQPKNNQMDYMLANQQWLKYCTSARNKANYPDLSEYERFRNVWVGLIPNRELFQRGYNIMTPESISNERVVADNIITNPSKLPQEIVVSGGNAESEY